MYICIMKYLITFLILNSVLFGQNLDSLTFGFINQYRIKNGKQPLKWSEDLHKTSIKHNNNMVVNDSIYHSHGYVYSENVLYGTECGLNGPKNYKDFIKKYFDLDYEDVQKNINFFIATTVVHSWYLSSGHNRIMLRPDTEGAVNVVYKDLIKRPNVIFGKVLFEGWGQFYYKLTLASTFQIK